MANISVTYSFTNGTTASASEVNQNFTDIINGTSDGTKNFSISALTVAGTLTANGNVTLGNATSDDITITGSLASTINIKTTATYNIGSATLGLAGIYLGNSTFTTKLATGATESWTFTLPTTAGTAGQGLVNSGSGTVAWAPAQYDINTVTNDDYTVLDDDGYGTILFSTGNTDRTLTLPTASANTDRSLYIKKIDSGTGKVTIDGENSETIDGLTTKALNLQYESYRIKCDGSNWHIESVHRPAGWVGYTPASYQGFGTPTSVAAYYRRVGSAIDLQIHLNAGTTTGDEARVALPSGVTSGTTPGSNTTPVGNYFINKGTATQKGGPVFCEDNVTYVTFGAFGIFGTTAVSALAKAVGSSVVENGDPIFFFARGIPVSGWDP